MLLGPVLASLPQDRELTSILDLTQGLAGHSRALLLAAPKARLIGIDRDPKAQGLAKAALGELAERCDFQLCPFDEVQVPAGTVDFALADIGVSSMQLDEAERGFSFRRDGPLDMRMGPDCSRSAADIVNQSSAQELETILRESGEEPAARRIAEAIVKARLLGPFERTEELARLVRQHARPPRVAKGKSSVDAATLTFQALRIAVNDELGCLSRGLPRWLEALRPGGRLAVIAFHSLEDRIVKTTYKNWVQQGLGATLGPQPQGADDAERAQNPRSRSAKMRLFQKA